MYFKFRYDLNNTTLQGGNEYLNLMKEQGASNSNTNANINLLSSSDDVDLMTSRNEINISTIADLAAMVELIEENPPESLPRNELAVLIQENITQEVLMLNTAQWNHMCHNMCSRPYCFPTQLKHGVAPKDDAGFREVWGSFSAILRNEPVNMNDKGKRLLEQEDNIDPRKKGKVVYDQGPSTQVQLAQEPHTNWVPTNIRTTEALSSQTAIHMAEGMFGNLPDLLPIANLEALGQTPQIFEHVINLFL